MKRVSVILPTFNGMRYIRKAIDSVLSQTYNNIELIVVVDGSTDDTASILNQYTDPRLKIIFHQTNQGLPQALNTGFAYSTGDYLTWTSDDNRYIAQAIAVMVEYLEIHSDVAFVYAPYWEIGENEDTMRLKKVWPSDMILNFNPVGPCFLYHRYVYEEIGEYDTSTFLFEDYDYWLRISQKFKIKSLAEPLYYYRLHKNALTGQPGVIHKRWRLGTRMKRERFGLPWHRYWLEMARIDIDEAFACYRDGNFARVPLLALRGLARNPAWILNLGVTSIMIRSLFNILKGHRVK